MKTIIEMFKDKNGKWRWHAARAGRIVAESGESYSGKTKCRKPLLAFLESIQSNKFDLHGLWRDSKNPR